MRLAVLLQSGLQPLAAWRYLARAGDADATAVVAAAGDGGERLPEAIAARGAGWHALAAAWRIAHAVGAPLADSLRALAAALEEADESRDEVRVAVAEPAATSRLLRWLPLVGLALGFLLGFDPVTVLVASPVGIACALSGAGLMVAASLWNARLVRRAQPDGVVPGLSAELLAIALSGGVSLDRARELLDGTPPDDDTEQLLALSRTAGVPAVELLRASASLARHRSRIEGRLRAASLSSQLLLPLGICVLPAFVALGVAPMLLSIIGSTSLSP